MTLSEETQQAIIKFFNDYRNLKAERERKVKRFWIESELNRLHSVRPLATEGYDHSLEIYGEENQHVLTVKLIDDADNCEDRFKLEVELADGINETTIYSRGNEPVAAVKGSTVELHGWVRQGIVDAGFILTN